MQSAVGPDYRNIPHDICRSLGISQWPREKILTVFLGYRSPDGTVIAGPQQTLEQYLKEWLESHKQTIRPRSWERYEAIVRLHLVHTLGKLTLQKLTPQHLDRLYREKLESGLKPKEGND